MWVRATRALLVASLALLGIAGSAQARQVQQYHYNGEFFETGGTRAAAIAVDGSSEEILVADVGDKESGVRISKFNLDGSPAGFSGRGEATSFSTGVSFANSPRVTVAIDESGTASDGNFYVNREGSQTGESRTFAYNSAGDPLPGFPLSIIGGCGLAVSPNGHLWIASEMLDSYGEFTSSGNPTGRVISGTGLHDCRIAIDQAGNLYVSKGEPRLAKYDPDLHFLSKVEFFDQFAGTQRFALDRGDGTIFELVTNPFLSRNVVVQADPGGNPLTSLGGPDPAHFSYGGIEGVAPDFAVDSQTHKVYVLNGSNEVNVFERDADPTTVPTPAAEEVENMTGTSATLRGTVDPDGLDTTDCHFDWGPTNQFGEFAGYSKSVPCDEGNVFGAASGVNQVSATLSGLTKGDLYHYRLSVQNANGVDSVSPDREFRAADPPSLSAVSASRVTTDSARIGVDVNTNGEDTTFHVEVGTDTSYGMAFPVPDVKVSTAFLQAPGFETLVVILTPQPKSIGLQGLKPNIIYHYRIVAQNAAGVTEGQDHTFRTFALPSTGEDKCPNAQARQQTSSGDLLDCRGYELVSAHNTGGYDVRSALSPGVSAISTSPRASNAALYSMRSGTIPGIAGHPTNRGADPYLARRNSNGWSTSYVGLASNNPFATGPFASPLSGFDEALKSFSFGGEEICDPCFADGATDVPLRRGSSDITQGMTGSIDPPGPASPAGEIRKPLSADGSHLLFATTAQFEPDANSNGTDATVYSRDLKAGGTEVISTDESGATIANGDDVAALDVSADGATAVIGERVSTDAAGNGHYHLYLHIAGTEESVDLMPGTTEGALYGGMTEDGAQVFFTTKAQLSSSDTDDGADAYGVEVQGPGAAAPQILSQGSGAGDTDSCSPPGDPDSWNVPAGKGKCDVLAFAGGAGVASQAGDFYFLSPELLDGPSNGIQDQANLYLVEGGSTAPRFVATIDSSLVKPPPEPPTRPTLPGSFGGSHSAAQGIAVDQSTGDVYVAEAGGGQVSRYDSEGNPKNFTAGPGSGTNTMGGFSFVESSARVAVDNSGGPLDGSVYVTNTSSVRVFSPTGEQLGQLSGFSEACGVAVDQFNGDLYVGDYGTVKRFSPTSATLPISTANYAPVTGIGAAGGEACDVAADNGNVYAATWANGPAFQYSASQFTAGFPGVSGTFLNGSATAMSTDPVTHEVFVDTGSQIVSFDPSGTKQLTLGTGELSGSRGVAVNATSHHVYASNGFSIKEFGYESTSYVPIDNPAVLHAIHQAGTHDPSDFQLTPDGSYAAFASLLSLDGYDSNGHYEVFRYDVEGGDTPICASCSFSLSSPVSDAILTPYGSSLTDDGRLFFTTGEQLTLRDSNEKRDVYEWSEGKQELISTGTSPSDSELLSASADGKDVFFFTRQKLVPQDENGDNVRLYDAREDGGFEFGPPTFQCAASDECHGASTKAPTPLGAATTAGTPGQFQAEAKPSKCAKGKVKRRGRCVKRKPHKRAQRHANNKRAKANRGGGK